MTRTVQSYAGAHTVRPAKKPKRIKARRVTKGGRNSDPAKLAWIRSLRCLVFGRYQGWDSDPCSSRPSTYFRQQEVHHCRKGGSRATDKLTVPLCPSHHRLGTYAVQAIGRERFEARYGVNLMTEAKRYEAVWQARKASEAA